MSVFGWLDQSDAQRRRMLDVVGMFREQGSVDELGLGVIRDAFADMLFPGTSTIQTRARYHFFIPWIYLDLERTRVSSANVARRARNRELRLIEALLAGGELGNGVIGEQARKSLKRLPSSVYWTGLRQYGIRRFPGSLEQYHRSLDGFYRLLRESTPPDKGEEPFADRLPNWHPGLPEAPEGYLEETTLAVTAEEAEYLRERILTHQPDTLLAFLVDRGKKTRVDFPWEHSQYGSFGPHVREQLEHARNFSEAIHGAQILYNVMLAERLEAHEALERHSERLDDWVGKIETRLGELRSWELERFWILGYGENPRIPVRTRRFVERWLERALAHPGRVRTDEALRDLIADREQALKGPRARLTSRSALEQWGGASGIDQHNFRWPSARIIVDDCREGLRKPAYGHEREYARA